MKEADVLKACKEYLFLRGHFCARVNSGCFETKSGGWFKAVDVNGFPDLIGISKDGKPLAVECKSEKGRLSRSQEIYKAAFIARGGLYVLARGIEDLQINGL